MQLDYRTRILTVSLVQRSGRSHLTVIRTHKFLNHLLSSVAWNDKTQDRERQPLKLGVELIVGAALRGRPL